MTRFHKIHDFGHVRFAVPSITMGEVIYTRIEHAHTAFPVTTVATSNWYFKLQPVEGRLAATAIIPWAKRAGKNVSVPMTVAHEEEWETPLDELRARLSIEVAPPFPSITTTV